MFSFDCHLQTVGNVRNKYITKYNNNKDFISRGTHLTGHSFMGASKQ